MTDMECVLEIWESTLEVLKNNMEEISYLTWINTIEPIFVEADKFILKAPSLFSKGIVEARYCSLIKDTIFKVTSKEYRIEIITEMERKPSSSCTESQFNSTKFMTPKLNPAFELKNFILGESNRLAANAAQKVVCNSGDHYNPLYFFGGVGVGKTHLLHAIGNYVLTHDSVNLRYIWIEDFTHELIRCIKEDRYDSFITQYEKLDMLIVDDLQFIADRQRTQGELYKVLNMLLRKGSKIILAANKPPESIMVLNERFTALFELGAVIELKEPDIEMKKGILRQHAEEKNWVVPDEKLDQLAKGGYTGVRELKGALNRVQALAELGEMSELQVFPSMDEGMKVHEKLSEPLI